MWSFLFFSFFFFFFCNWVVIISFIYRWIFLSTFLFIKMIMQLAPSWVTTSPWCRAHHLNYNFHNMFSGFMTDSKSKLKILPMIIFYFLFWYASHGLNSFSCIGFTINYGCFNVFTRDVAEVWRKHT